MSTTLLLLYLSSQSTLNASQVLSPHLVNFKIRRSSCKDSLLKCVEKIGKHSIIGICALCEFKMESKKRMPFHDGHIWFRSQTILEHVACAYNYTMWDIQRHARIQVSRYHGIPSLVSSWRAREKLGIVKIPLLLLLYNRMLLLVIILERTLLYAQCLVFGVVYLL